MDKTNLEPRLLHCGESDDHEHYQLDDEICTPPAMFVEMGLQMRRQLRIG